MKILKRVKNQSGETIAYFITDGNQTGYVNKDAVIGMKDMVTNAKLLDNGEFRAINGSKIETIVDASNLLAVRNPRKSDKVPSVNMNSIDFYGKEFIGVCRKIRQYACSGRLQVDVRPHKSNGGNNIHLFKLIEACGISVKDFVTGYLSVLQPYSLHKYQGSKELSKGNIWIADVGYRVSLVIKINGTDAKSPLVVSFHESNYEHKYRSMNIDFTKKFCAILVDRSAYNGTVVNTNKDMYRVKYTVQRGFIRLSLDTVTEWYSNGVALIEYKYIGDVFEDTLSSIFYNVANTYASDIGSIPNVQKSDFKKLSFMSMGYSNVNNICLLIDLYAKFTESKSRLFLVEVARSLLDEIPYESLQEIKLALKVKFEGLNNKLYRAIVED